jgi:mannose-6-phosphate isomerase-like protein (cupin superfamily)
MDKINITEKLSAEDPHWFPALIGTVDNYDIKVVKIEGEFVWHEHDYEDEMFFVINGAFYMYFRDKIIHFGKG